MNNKFSVDATGVKSLKNFSIMRPLIIVLLKRHQVLAYVLNASIKLTFRLLNAHIKQNQLAKLTMEAKHIFQVVMLSTPS